jgi:predicted nucleic acid-binding protein
MRQIAGSQCMLCGSCLIAAPARRRCAPLVTANTAQFARVPGLVWEDWSVAG